MYFQLNVAKHAEKIRFHQLDVLDEKSMQKLHDDLKAEHGGVDILVNNAAIAFKVCSNNVGVSKIYC